MISLDNVPTIFNESGRNSRWAGLDELKQVHVAVSGYSIKVGEEITFPTVEALNKNPKKYIKILDARRGSQNKTALILVDRNGRNSWFNASVLSRSAYDSRGNVIDIDPLRSELRLMNDDCERVSYLLGKTIRGAGELDAYQRDFDPETHRPKDSYSEAKFVQIELVD